MFHLKRVVGGGGGGGGQTIQNLGGRGEGLVKKILVLNV